jgi:uncharacterized protein (DUF885 family)
MYLAKKIRIGKHLRRAQIAMLAVLISLLGPEIGAQETSTDSRTQIEFKKLIERRWEYWLRQFPEFATLVGDRRYNDRWTDWSIGAIETRRESIREFRNELSEIDSPALSLEDQLNYELLKFELDDRVEGANYAAGQSFPGTHDYSNLYSPITPMGGVQQKVLRFLSMMPAEGLADYENILARLRGIPRLVDQTIELMKVGLANSMSPPRITLRNVGDQIGGYVVKDRMESPLLAAFRDFPDALTEKEQGRLRVASVRAFENDVRPAFRRLHEFFLDEYLPRTRETIAASDMPNGVAVYAYNVRHFTTTNLSADKVHEIGMEEVKRIRSEMEQLIRDAGFDGSIAEFAKHLELDTGQFRTEAADLLAGYRDLAKRADGKLPRLFRRFPRMPYGVTQLPEEYEKTFSAAYYQPGSHEAGRAAEFVVNTYDLAARPRWEMEALVLHEAVPGHHMQVALSQELEGVPTFRRYYWPVAFAEGWALYAEKLGYQIGFYTDRPSKFGQLSSEMWRAVRLAVDTGIHSQGWTRKQAIEFFRTHTGKGEHDIALEIDRYIVWPGHALAYKIGELEITRLREHAKQTLGEAFDIRAFHDRILVNGAVPISILRRDILSWVASQGVGTRSPTE